MTDPWRLRCPEGHSTIDIYHAGYRCRSCGAVYEGEPYDAKHTDFPVRTDAGSCVSRDDVLEAVVRECSQPNKSRVAVSELSVESRSQAAQELAKLERDGLVRRLGCGSPRHYWQPTDAGIDAVQRQVSARPDGKRAPARGQATPIGAAILTLVVGLVLAFSVALASGVFI